MNFPNNLNDLNNLNNHVRVALLHFVSLLSLGQDLPCSWPACRFWAEHVPHQLAKLNAVPPSVQATLPSWPAEHLLDVVEQVDTIADKGDDSCKRPDVGGLAIPLVSSQGFRGHVDGGATC